MKKALLIVFLLVIAGLAASIWLVPKMGELALINYKDKRFAEALQSYEVVHKQGTLTPELVNSLVELYLQDGEINKAIGVLEEYLQQDPNNVEVRRRLGKLYQYAQRPDDYLTNLEQLSQLSPSADAYTELSQIYNYNRQYERQADALRKLIELEQGKNPDHFKELANILASEGKHADSATVLMELRKLHPNAFSFKEAELAVSLYLDAKNTDGAISFAKWWKERKSPPREVARLINLLHYKGRPEYAYSVLNLYKDEEISASPPLLEEQVLLMLDEGKEDEAYGRLVKLHESGRLSVRLQNQLLFLAIDRGDEKLAQNLIKTIKIDSLNESQAMALLELSLLRNDTDLRARLTKRFAARDLAKTYPLVHRLLAVANGQPNAQVQLAQLDRIDLTTTQLLQGARVCIRMKQDVCSARFLSRLPQPQKLDDQEVRQVAELYYTIGAYQKGMQFTDAVAKTRKSPVVEEARVKFAAVLGDTNTVEKWLVRDGQNATTRTLNDLFFAARKHNQHALSARIAEILYEKKKTPETRTYLSSAYISSGRYADAVQLLRGANNLSEADESNYLLALTKLSRNNAEYRRELGAYAGSQLKGTLPYRRKMALVYALINAGQIEPAMPHIRQLAMRNGGRWAWLYAEQLTKQGKHEEARSFWIELSQKPYLSDNERYQIGHALLAGGYRDDALPIFERLATGKSIASKEMKELLYLWGPRVGADRLNWMAEQMNRAPEGERQAWSKLIAARAGTEDIIPFAEDQHPELLGHKEILAAYVRALALSEQLADKHPALMQGLKELGDPAVIGAYADAAMASNAKDPAQDAYMLQLQYEPENKKALREAGLIAFGQADYSGAKEFFSRYIDVEGISQETPENAQNVAFYYAELLKREGSQDQSHHYFEQVVAIVDGARLDSADALSHKAKSLMELGHTEQGISLYESATSFYPDNGILYADYITALIERENYELARTLLDEPLYYFSLPPEAPASLPVPSNTVGQCTSYALGSEALIEFRGNQDDMRQFASNAETLDWVSYVNEGYGKLLLVSRPGYILRLEEDATGQMSLIPIPVRNDKEREELHIRYELLAARIDLETGHTYAATERLNNLLPAYPDDPELLGFAANAENYGGNVHRARTLLDMAGAMAPRNEDIALLQHRIRRDSTEHVMLDYEWIQRGRNDEYITTLSAMADLSSNLVLGVKLQNNDVKTKNVRRADGRVGNFAEEVQRGEVSVTYHAENGKRATATVYANNDTVGAGVEVAALNPLGETGAKVEYHRPYWEFAEAAIDDATRDRASLWHRFKPTPKWQVYLEPGINNYNTSARDNVMRTVSFNGDITYRPVEDNPYIYFAYGINAEYRTSQKRYLDAQNRSYTAIPLVSREIHFASVHIGHEFTERTYASVLAGYGYDRLGGSGPLVEGQLTHEFTDDIDAQVRASYGIDTQRSNSDQKRLGGYVRWRF